MSQNNDYRHLPDNSRIHENDGLFASDCGSQICYHILLMVVIRVMSI